MDYQTVWLWNSLHVCMTSSLVIVSNVLNLLKLKCVIVVVEL